MKVAHVAVVTPHRAGLYETTRDLVAAERAAGVDARIVDPVTPTETTDRGVPIVTESWAAECDVMVNHSGISKQLDALQLPIIHVLHGRPHSSFLLEQSGKIPVYTYLTTIRTDPRYKIFLTFWPEFIPYWSTILPNEKLHTLTPPVDLDHWTPNGPTGYAFHGHKAKVNVVCTSMWRQDETPYHIINAFHLFALRNPGAKLHIYAAPQKGGAWAALRQALQEKGMLGEIQPMVEGLENVYRAAQVAITPHHIATRSVREPLACGCNVVMAPGNRYTPFVADPQDLDAYARQIQRAVEYPAANRRTAQAFFDPADTAAQMIYVLKQVTDGNH